MYDTSRVKPNVNKYGLRVLMCRRSFNKCKKGTTLVEKQDNQGGYAYAGVEGLGEISEPSA